MTPTKQATYNPRAIEAKWQEFWEKHQLFQSSQDQEINDAAEKLYLLFAFAYPSGSGLHVGHVESKTALDIMARYYRMQGKKVLFPVGWDAFGLPAENYAVKTGVPPAVTTKNAINTFRRQIKRIGISYDWVNEIATCHPGYYKWTQWLFLELYRKGLAYKAPGLVNWCPSCQTVLANEQVVNGACERCGTQVVQKNLKQWYFKITEYADELISGLDKVDWPGPTKQQQLHWIGKSEGAIITFKTTDGIDLDVYTTAHDTIFGCTFMVIAPENKWLVDHKDNITNWSEVSAYSKKTEKKTERQRQVNRDKTGVKVGGVAFINPANGKEIPLYVSDYVLAGYGTGAIMAVPGHDERDREFAQKFNLNIVPTAKLKDESESPAFISYGDIKQDPAQFIFINSEKYDGLDYQTGRVAMLTDFKKAGFGQAHTQYKLRDWLISRQRYWGAPIPIVYDPEGNPHPVKEEHLPWTLPEDVDFKPTGESPLHYSKEFLERTEKLYGKGWTPEFDTMDTFVDSSWYFLRYPSARDEQEFANPDQLKKWLPVDFYMIGPEHIVLHLLYSRFFTKFLRDQGYLTFDEPFMKMRHQGMILGPNGKKMSKSKGNVINPDDVVDKFGSDTLRVYEMFMGPIEADKPWDVSAVAGVYRFLTRIHKLVMLACEGYREGDSLRGSENVRRKLNQTIKKVSEDIPQLKFNTAIAALMELINIWEDALKVPQRDENSRIILPESDVRSFVKMIAPFAPFLAEELHSHFPQGTVKEAESIHQTKWPSWDASLIKENLVNIAVQVNGKVRGQISVKLELVDNKEAILDTARTQTSVARWLDGQTITKEIYVPGKIVSFVTR